MKEYHRLRLTASHSPHIHGSETVRSIMLHVIIALLPALGYACYWFGLRTLMVVGVSVVSCVLWEALCRLLMGKTAAVGDLSAVVTGILLAYICPVNISYGQILLGSFFAIVVVKQLFGGLGGNFMNPALAGRAFLMASWASVMGGDRVDPYYEYLPAAGTVDTVMAATPLSYMKGDNVAETFRLLTEKYSLLDMFLGRTGGALGEVCALALLAGGYYLVRRKIISWHIPASYIGTVAAVTALFPRGGAEHLPWMLYSLCGGGLLLGAFFMATDYVTSPVSRKGQVVYGIGCGLLTVLIRYFGIYEEGMIFAILVMNCFTALIDRAIRPARFGAATADRQRRAAE